MSVLPNSPPKKQGGVFVQSNSLLEQIKYTIIFYMLKTFVSIFVFLSRVSTIKNYLPAQPFSASAGLPTFTKTYSIRPTLKNRIFIPQSWKTGDPPLPIYFDVHGGGYALTDPQFDDEFCYPFCNKYNIVVISIDYHLSPGHRFPTQIHDIVAIIQEVLEDQSLPLDHSKVALGGSSAGGNLVLAVSQVLQQILPDLIKGVVSFYPVVDYTRTFPEQLATRPADSGIDSLASIMGLCQWGYIPQGEDLTNPLISVGFAGRASLPARVFVVGCELDLMCWDAEQMARRWGDECLDCGDGYWIGDWRYQSKWRRRSSNLSLDLDSDSDVAWERNGVRWEKVLGVGHGFDQFPALGAKRFVARRRAGELRARVGEWLFREVYA